MGGGRRLFFFLFIICWLFFLCYFHCVVFGYIHNGAGTLSIQAAGIQISETGAFTVKAEIAKQGTIKAFDDLQTEAVIDGTISADLYQNGRKVGSALLVLPVYGIGSRTTVEGICLSGAAEKVPYEVRFTPYHLWAMEK